MQENPLAFSLQEKSQVIYFQQQNGVNYSYLYQKFVWQEDKKNQKRLPKQVLILNELSVLIAKCQKREQKNRNKHVAMIKNVIKAAQFDISPSDFSRNALNVVEKLQRQGFEAYIVGGCIRDLLLGKKPKDFDVATNARPEQIQNIFSTPMSFSGSPFPLSTYYVWSRYY